MVMSPPFSADCQTTAMGIMPHTDIGKALDLALGLDIPFWPQLPNVSYYEDMYAQASEHFPGMRVSPETEQVTFDSALFQEEVSGEYLAKLETPDAFGLTEQYSRVYHKFLDLDLARYSAIRGQMIGPVSFSFRVVDEDRRPIIYDDEVRTILFDFLQRKVNVQYRELRKRNRNAFVWLDEPGLGWVFGGMTGYNDLRAREDYEAFLSGIEGPKGLHLCAAVNLSYLLELGVDILSFDAYQIESMARGYAEAVAAFLRKGGIICWGIVPTEPEVQGRETPRSLTDRLSGYWRVVADGSGLTMGQIARQSLIAPARCMLKNSGLVGAIGETVGHEGVNGSGRDEEKLVETGFSYTKEVGRMMRERWG